MDSSTSGGGKKATEESLVESVGVGRSGPVNLLAFAGGFLHMLEAYDCFD